MTVVEIGEFFKGLGEVIEEAVEDAQHAVEIEMKDMEDRMEDRIAAAESARDHWYGLYEALADLILDFNRGLVLRSELIRRAKEIAR